MRSFITSLYPTPDPDYDKRHRSVAWFLTTFTIVLIFIILSTIVIAASNYKSDLTAPNTFTLVGMSLLVGATGFAGGGFVGFIFGVPKVRTLDEGVANREVASNTNLEQVSDWLTKIIVGVSLVQFGRIVDALSSFSAAVDTAMAGKNTDLGGAGFIASLILVGSAIAGFLAAYLKSKTDLMDAFAPIAEVRSDFGKAVADQLIGQVGRGVLNLPDMEVDKCARDAAAKLIQIIPSKSDDPKMHEMAGLSHAILKNFAASADALERGFDLRPAGSTSDLGALAARAYALAGNASKARQLSQRAYSASDLSSSDDDARVAAREAKLADLFTSLYARGGYEHVIETGKQLLSDPDMQSSSRLWLYLACAYGQRQSALIRENKDPDQLAINRADALSALNKAVSLDPNGNKQTLRMLIDPTNKTKSPEENDLEIFYDDREFRSALGIEG